jgi:hypothetical protein
MIARLIFYLLSQSDLPYCLLRLHTILIKNFPRDTSMIATTTADLIWGPTLQCILRTKSWQPRWPGRNAGSMVAAMKVLESFCSSRFKRNRRLTRCHVDLLRSVLFQRRRRPCLRQFLDMIRRICARLVRSNCETMRRCLWPAHNKRPTLQDRTTHMSIKRARAATW